MLSIKTLRSSEHTLSTHMSADHSPITLSLSAPTTTSCSSAEKRSFWDVDFTSNILPRALIPLDPKTDTHSEEREHWRGATEVGADYSSAVLPRGPLKNLGAMISEGLWWCCRWVGAASAPSSMLGSSKYITCIYYLSRHLWNYPTHIFFLFLKL